MKFYVDVDPIAVSHSRSDPRRRRAHRRDQADDAREWDRILEAPDALRLLDPKPGPAARCSLRRPALRPGRRRPGTGIVARIGT
ncbi:hypothetical protein HBB16_15535 [Pseudonocardia sp. MCCB 268]|nr:hypothetical protein [Pseudonocardia cytotoxica]